MRHEAIRMKQQNTIDDIRGPGAGACIRPRALPSRTLTVFMLLITNLCIGIVHAEVPTAGHIAACNREAREALRSPTVVPIPKDEVGADDARKAGTAAVDVPGANGEVTQSPDAQIQGMDGDGAKNAASRAAYRVCMRRNGF